MCRYVLHVDVPDSTQIGTPEISCMFLLHFSFSMLSVPALSRRITASVNAFIHFCRSRSSAASKVKIRSDVCTSNVNEPFKRKKKVRGKDVRKKRSHRKEEGAKEEPDKDNNYNCSGKRRGQRQLTSPTVEDARCTKDMRFLPEIAALKRKRTTY